MPSTLPGRRGGRFRKLGFGLFVTIAVFSFAEVACRYLPTTWREVESASEQEGWVQTSSVPGWDLTVRGNAAVGHPPGEVDAYRMRSPGYPEEKGDAVRLIFAGDSCMYGYGLSWPATIAAQTERAREARFPGVDYQAAACAVPGHSSLQTRIKLQDYCLAFEPDVVVIASQFNDAAFVDIADAKRFERRLGALTLRALHRSALLETLAAQIVVHDSAATGPTAANLCHSGWLPPGKDLCPSIAKETHRVDLDSYGANLSAMVTLARGAGAWPVLLINPHGTDEEAGTEYPFHPYRTRMREVAAKRDVILVDGPALFRASGRQWAGLFLDRLHPTPEGARLLAAAIDSALGPQPP